MSACDFDIAIAGEGRAHGVERSVVIVEGCLETSSEQAGLEPGGAEHGLLRESHLLEGEQLLGVDGLVDGDGVLLETGDLVKVFEPDDGEAGGGETVSAGVAGGTGLALGSARAGAFGGVGARLAASCFSEIAMCCSFLFLKYHGVELEFGE